MADHGNHEINEVEEVEEVEEELDYSDDDEEEPERIDNIKFTSEVFNKHEFEEHLFSVIPDICKTVEAVAVMSKPGFPTQSNTERKTIKQLELIDGTHVKLVIQRSFYNGEISFSFMGAELLSPSKNLRIYISSHENTNLRVIHKGKTLAEAIFTRHENEEDKISVTFGEYTLVGFEVDTELNEYDNKIRYDISTYETGECLIAVDYYTKNIKENRLMKHRMDGPASMILYYINDTGDYTLRWGETTYGNINYIVSYHLYGVCQTKENYDRIIAEETQNIKPAKR